MWPQISSGCGQSTSQPAKNSWRAAAKLSTELKPILPTLSDKQSQVLEGYKFAHQAAVKGSLDGGTGSAFRVAGRAVADVPGPTPAASRWRDRWGEPVEIPLLLPPPPLSSHLLPSPARELGCMPCKEAFTLLVQLF